METTRLYVGNLPYDIDDFSIKEFFEEGGDRTVTQIKIVMDRATGRQQAFAFVEMLTPEQAQSAIDELHGQELGGRTIVVNEATESQRAGLGDRRGERGRGGGYGGGGYGGNHDD